MGQVSSKLRRATDGYSYWCQGCEEMHHVRTEPAGWTFDGNVEAPTFSPSVLVTSGHYMPGHPPGKACWCTYYKEHPQEVRDFECGRCHTFIRGGLVEFLSDCTHALAGQTLPLPDLPPELQDGPR